MAGQYTDFLASLGQYGIAKTSHFSLSIPIVIRGSDGSVLFSDMDRLMGLRCESAELPGRQLISNDSRTYGPTYKTPYQSLYQETTFNFLETDTFLIRTFFEAWMSIIFNPTTNMLAFPETYHSDITLRQYDVVDGSRPHSVKETVTPPSNLETIAKWEMFNAFPTSVNQMPVSWSEDGLHRTTVTMAFEWYQLITGPGSSNRSVRHEFNASPKPPKGSSDGIFASLRSKLPF